MRALPWRWPPAPPHCSPWRRARGPHRHRRVRRLEGRRPRCAPPHCPERPAGALRHPLGLEQPGRGRPPARCGTQDPARLRRRGNRERPRRAAPSPDGPNGDVLISEMQGGTVRVLRLAGGKVRRSSVLGRGSTSLSASPSTRRAQPAMGLCRQHRLVVRFAYQQRRPQGARAGRDGRPASADRRRHRTRDVVFSPDGRTCCVSVGSASNVCATPWASRPRRNCRTSSADARARRRLGQGDRPRRRARLRPDGKNGHIYATGLRNCVGMAVQPATGDSGARQRARRARRQPPSDYVTRVRGRRLLRLALVLHRRQRGPAAARASGPT